MRDGFIKAAVATPKVIVADCEHNAKQIIELMRQAADKKARILALPELCITGYTCGDLFSHRILIDSASDALLKIVQASKEQAMITVVGLPLIKGGKLYNCAAVVYNGEILGIVPKKNLPNYSEFYEERHFSEAPEDISTVKIGENEYPFGTDLIFRCEGMRSFTLAVEICEDLWVPQPPSVEHALAGANIIVNLSASDEIIGKEDYRRSLVVGQSGRLVCGYVYADAGEGESTTDVVFSGHNLIAEYGTLLAESRPFRSELVISEIDVDFLENERRKVSTFKLNEGKGYLFLPFRMKEEQTELTREFPTTPFVPTDVRDREYRCEMILSMQSYGLKKRMEHTGSKTALIGISGGLDSCLTLLVTVRTMDLLGLPRKNVIAVNMPCFGTTERTKSNAETLCENLGVTLRTIDITDSVLKHFSDIGHDPAMHNTTFENAQARERTQIIMDIANEENGLVIGTGDLSEGALGWTTYNGDHMSMYNVNASVPKTLVRHIVRYAADTAGSEQERAVLLDILDTPVSPELLPAKDGQIEQKTEEIVGPYELHDFFLYYSLRRFYTPKKILRLAQRSFEGTYDKKTIHKWMKTFYRRFFSQQFKRSCLPDGPKIGSVTLSPRSDLRMPSDASAALWLKDIGEE